MRIGYDFVQPSFARAGSGWYVQSLLEAMSHQAPDHEFLAYRDFGEWFVDSDQKAALPERPNITDPLAPLSKDAIARTWHNELAAGKAPGRPTLVHSTSFQSPRFTSTKLVLTIFDLSFWAVPEFTTDANRIHCQTGILTALDHADGLIFISEHARREFHNFLPAFRREKEILTTVTPLASRWAPRQVSPAASGDYWLFVGSIEPRKNLINLLSAYEGYLLNHPAPKPLWLAGGGGWKNEEILARIAPLEARGLIRLLGYVPDQQLQNLYRKAHALIFPSWYEGFGLPVLEAMTQGCPVICSNRTSLPEVGGDAVCYTDPSRPETITAAMIELEQNPSHRSVLINHGLVRAHGFSWARTAKQTLAFYEHVCASSRECG